MDHSRKGGRLCTAKGQKIEGWKLMKDQKSYKKENA